MSTFADHIAFLRTVWNVTSDNCDDVRTQVEHHVPPVDPNWIITEAARVASELGVPDILPREEKQKILENLLGLGPTIASCVQLCWFLLSPPELQHDEILVDAVKAHCHLDTLEFRVCRATLMCAALALQLVDISTSSFLTCDASLTLSLEVKLPPQHNTLAIYFSALRDLFEEEADEVALLRPANVVVATAETLQPEEVPTMTRKQLLALLNLEIKPLDKHFMAEGGAPLVFALPALRASYLLASDINEMIVFDGGNVQLSLDDTLNILLEHTILPDCLHGLATQMLNRQWQWRQLRGKMVCPYDLFAMIPAAVAANEDPNAPPPDSLPRGEIIGARSSRVIPLVAVGLLLSGAALCFSIRSKMQSLTGK